MNREQLVDQLNNLSKQQKEIRDQIDKLDYDERLSQASQFLDKYFIEVDKNSDQVRCAYVYYVNLEDCQNQYLLITYYKDSETFFSIEWINNFTLLNYKDEISWSEISKEEFLIHYNNVQNKINKIINENIAK